MIIGGDARDVRSYRLKDDRDALEICKELQNHILPWRHAAKLEVSKMNLDASADMVDLTATRYLDFLDWAVVVFWQDAAMMKLDFPNLPMWDHVMFKGVQIHFEALVKKAKELREQPASERHKEVRTWSIVITIVHQPNLCYVTTCAGD